VTPTDSEARRLRDSLEVIATIGWWSPPARRTAKRLGLRFVEAYVWGRAAPLGADAPAAVVSAAFGVFAPDLVSGPLAAARGVIGHDEILAAREEGARTGLREATATIAPALIDDLGTRLTTAVASIDGAGRPLFGGLRALPVPADPHGRLWRAAESIREHRGDGHLAACVAAGLRPIEMNVLTELWLGYPLGEYSSTRGHPADAIAATADRMRARGWIAGNELAPAGRTLRAEIEAATDASQRELVEALGTDLDRVIASAQAISTDVLAAGAGPVDPRKRAAG
jgi:hypothetical protein